MKIEAKTKADLVALHIKSNQSHDGREAYADIDVSGVDRETAVDKFGEEFADLAFSTMRVTEDDDGGQHVGFLVDSIKPGKRVVCEKHGIEICGESLSAQPELLKIRTVDGAEKVVPRFRIPVPVDKGELLAKLTSNVGQVVDVHFSPQQQQLDFSIRRGGEENGEPASQLAAV